MRRRFIAISLFALLFALGWWAGRGRASGDLYARLDTFIEILHKVEESYVEPVEPRHLIQGAVHGMLRDLDPYAEYVEGAATPDAAAERASADVGLALGARDNAWIVIAPAPGGPADLAAVRSGDVLDQVDGRSTSGWTRGEVEARLHGAPGTRVRLTLVRAGEDTPFDVTLTRGSLPQAPRASGRMVEKGIALVRLPAIDDGSAGEIKALLARLRGEGATRLALDLRGCATGNAKQGADVAQLFLARGAVVADARGRVRDAAARRLAADSAPQLDWPLAVIVDQGSAGAAEVLAGALQDNDRALLFGRTTFGLASTQTDFKLEGGNAHVRLTTAVQLTPSGRPIQSLAVPGSEDDEDGADSPAPADSAAAARTYATRSGRAIKGGGGIRPDVEFPADSSAATALRPAGDPWLARALETLRRARAPRDVFAAATGGAERN